MIHSRLLCFIAAGVAAPVMMATSAAIPAGFGTRYHTDTRTTPRVVFHPATPLAKTGTGEALARAYLSQNHARFALPADLANLTLTRTQPSMTATHYRFSQYINGIPVNQAEIIVSIAKHDDTILRVYNNTYPVTHAVPAPTKAKQAPDSLDAAWKHLRVHKRLILDPGVERVYMPVDGDFALTDKVHISTEGPFGHWEVQIDPVTGKVRGVAETAIKCFGKHAGHDEPIDFGAYTGPILDRQLAMAARNRKALATAPEPGVRAVVDGSGEVFDPNPVITLMRDDLEDGSAASNFVPAYRTRALKDITESSGTYSLVGPWAQIVDLESPTTAPSTTTNGVWDFVRGNNAFNDAVCYFHIDQNQRYIQSLGFTGPTGIQELSIRIDSDALSGEDQSHYVGGANYIAFGHGCVDDSEDADVILHEYGHAIQITINGSWSGGDTGAMGEGFGDYWAASYRLTTPNGPTFNPDWVFSWDGHNNCWPGRVLSRTNAIYNPQETYTPHDVVDGIITDEYWSTPLFTTLRTLMALGRPREEVDQIILESHFGLSSGVTMADMAAVTVQTAKTLFPSGPHSGVFEATFAHHKMFAKLPTPILHQPAADDVLLTNAPSVIAWSLNGATNAARCVLEFSDRCNGVDAVFSDDMESGINGWAVSHTTGTTDWAQVTNSSHTPATAWFAPDVPSLSDIHLVSPGFPLTPGMEVTFWHRYELEDTYDGGVLEVSTSGTSGPFTDIGGNATANGYDGTIDAGFNSPISGRQAFTGNSAGFIRSIVPLPQLTATAHLRFRLASDSNEADTGWWIDDVNVSLSSIWSSIGQSSPGATNFTWIVPGNTGNAYCVRIHLAEPNHFSSDAVESGSFTVTSIDADGDGILFNQEIALGLDPMVDDRLVDNDGDMLSNYGEAVAGTGHNNASSVFEVVEFTRNSPVMITFSSVVGRTYSVYYATNLVVTNWNLLASPIAGSNALTSVADTNTTPLRFYRLGVKLTP